jgi:hypothetical protein
MNYELEIKKSIYAIAYFFLLNLLILTFYFLLAARSTLSPRLRHGRRVACDVSHAQMGVARASLDPLEMVTSGGARNNLAAREIAGSRKCESARRNIERLGTRPRGPAAERSRQEEEARSCILARGCRNRQSLRCQRSSAEQTPNRIPRSPTQSH